MYSYVLYKRWKELQLEVKPVDTLEIYYVVSEEIHWWLILTNLER